MGGILIIEFNDFCVALHCPENFSASQSTMDAMRKILPSRPIKYVVTSHTHGVMPDSLFYSRREPIIVTFKDKKVITDGVQTLELYNIGKNLHTDEMTIAYLPKQKILWQADQFFVPHTGGHLNTAMPITVAFARN